MAEYIERERLVETLTDIIDDYKEERTFSTDFAATVVADILSDVVKSQPVADVAPVRHGRWIENTDGIYCWIECSECGGAAPRDIDAEIVLSNYCQNCWAKMDGENDE